MGRRAHFPSLLGVGVVVASMIGTESCGTRGAMSGADVSGSGADASPADGGNDASEGGLTAVTLLRPTELQYLSGRGSDDAVTWDFYCASAVATNRHCANSGTDVTWSSIPVPSNWELQGFGADAEDLEQDVFLSLFERLSRVRYLGLRNYVVSTTIFSLRRRLRHQRVLDRATSRCVPVPASNRSIAPNEEARGVLASLARIVDGLTGRDRTLFMLRVVDRRSLPEVARKVGSSLSTVKRRMRRLRRHVTALASRDLYLSGYKFPGDGATQAPARRK